MTLGLVEEAHASTSIVVGSERESFVGRREECLELTVTVGLRMTWNARPIRYLYTLNKTSLMLSCLRFVRAELILIRSLSGYKQAKQSDLSQVRVTIH